MKKVLLVLAVVVPFAVIGSIAVWQLSGTDQRRVGALGPLSEPVPLAWRGAWSAEAKYAAGQVVSFEGSSYVAETDADGISPNPKECEKECPWTPLGGAGVGTQGAQGPQGPKGDPGAPGPKGDPGSSGSGPVTGRQLISKEGEACIRQAQQPGSPFPICLEMGPAPEATVNCPAGKVATGGGGGERSEPRGNGWYAKNPGQTPVTVYVICVNG